MFDKDGDGVLNESERAEAEKFMAEQGKRFDRDGDGQLSAEERGEALKAFAAEHPDMMPPAK
jgi:Ca2+-binding EF-hand superfamily protein